MAFSGMWRQITRGKTGGVSWRFGGSSPGSDKLTWADITGAIRALDDFPSRLELWEDVDGRPYWVEKPEADVWRTDFYSAVAP